MPDRVFVSHGGADSEKALAVARELESRGLQVDVDRDQLRTGDTFLKFMETALSACDYCLLLWSEAAARGKWVEVEWQAALYRTIEESRRFLLVGRLEAYTLPALLAPRLYTDLFPEIFPGLDSILSLWKSDDDAEKTSNRPVANGTKDLPADANGATVYLTSDLFGITQPLRLDLGVPAGIHLDQILKSLELPRELDHKGVMGVRYEYRLVRDNTSLTRAATLAAQGVEPGTVLWLEVEMKPYAKGAAVAGALTGATFRGGNDAERYARDALLDAISAAGMGV
jgi:TIR domain